MKPDRQQVFIVGPRRFQNEIMAEWIKKASGYHCSAKLRMADVPVRSPQTSRQKNLILVDCLGMDGEALFSALQNEASDRLNSDFVALFNLGCGLGMEREALTRGIRGLFFENDAGESLCRGVQAILNGELWVTRKVMTECLFEIEKYEPQGKHPCVLTSREKELLALLAMGSTNVFIADQLCISPHTVKTHIYNIFKKINVPNRLQAALWAAKHL